MEQDKVYVGGIPERLLKIRLRMEQVKRQNTYEAYLHCFQPYIPTSPSFFSLSAFKSLPCTL